MRKNLFRVVFAWLIMFSLSNSGISEITTSKKGKIYEDKESTYWIDGTNTHNINNNNCNYAVWFKGYTYIFSRVHGTGNITYKRLKSKSNLELYFEDKSKDDNQYVCQDKDIGTGLVAVVYNQMLYVFYDVKDPNDKKYRFIYYKTCTDPSLSSWSEERRLEYNNNPLRIDVGEGFDEDKRLNMAAAVLGSKDGIGGNLYFFFTCSRSGGEHSDYLYVWVYDNNKWLQMADNCRHIKTPDFKYGPIHAQTVVINKEERIAILAVQRDPEDDQFGDNNVLSMLFYDGKSTYNKIQDSIRVQYPAFQIRTLYGFPIGGYDQENLLQVVVGYGNNETEIYNCILQSNLNDVKFKQFFTPGEQFPAFALPVVSFIDSASRSVNGAVDIDAYCHFIGLSNWYMTVKSDSFRAIRREEVSSEDTMKLMTLVGVIEGVPPFVVRNGNDNDSAWMNNSVSLSRGTDCQSVNSSVYSTVFCAGAGYGGDLGSIGVGASGAFSKAYDTCRSVSHNITADYATRNDCYGNKGLMIFLKPELIKGIYHRIGYGNRLYPGEFSYIYVSGSSIYTDYFDLESPPVGMLTDGRRARTCFTKVLEIRNEEGKIVSSRDVTKDEVDTQLGKWKVMPSCYSRYRSVSFNVLTCSPEISMNMNSTEATSKTTSQSYSYDTSINLQLLIASADVSTSKDITVQNSCTTTRALYMNLEALPYPNDIGIKSLSIQPYLYQPVLESTGAVDNEKLPWVPDDYKRDKPWLLTWKVDAVKEKQNFLSKIVTSVGQTVSSGYRYVTGGGIETQESQSQATTQPQQQGPTIISY